MNTGRYWEMVARLKITHFYAALTTIRKLLRYGDDCVTKYDRSSLKVLGCGRCGLMINYSGWGLVLSWRCGWAWVETNMVCIGAGKHF